jgi:hypothetical protein
VNNCDLTIRALHNSGVPMTLDEARELAKQVPPLYRDGRLTWTALITACRILYRGYDRYSAQGKANLLPEARHVLRVGELADA